MRIKLITNRLIIRDAEKKDAKDIAESLNNLNISKHLLNIPYPYTLNHAKKGIKIYGKESRTKPRIDYHLVIELKSIKKVIGAITLEDVNRFNQQKAEIKYWIGEKYWHKGYASEAVKAVISFSFHKLKLRKLVAGVFAENQDSKKLLEKFNFKREGLERESLISRADKKTHDAYVYGLLRKDYKP